MNGLRLASLRRTLASGAQPRAVTWAAACGRDLMAKPSYNSSTCAAMSEAAPLASEKSIEVLSL
jgi:hypothetical protein